MTTIKSPSEENIFDWELISGEPLNTSGQPFEFYYLDECGNKEAVDMSENTFQMDVYYNDCLYLTSNNLVVDDIETNKVYISISSLDLKSGLYDYVIKIVGGISVISGKIRIK